MVCQDLLNCTCNLFDTRFTFGVFYTTVTRGSSVLLVIAAKFWAQYHRPIAIHCKITFVLSDADPNRAVRNSKIRSFATLPYLDMMLLDSVLLLLTENEKFTTGVL